MLRRWRRRVDSLKARMALLMGLVLVLPAAYAVVQSVGAYHAEAERLAGTLQRTARLIATYQGGILDKARAALESVAQGSGPPVQGQAECSAALAAELQKTNDFSLLAIAGPDGRVLCATTPELIGTNVAARPWFERLGAGFRFVVSELTRPREDSPVKTIIIAVPMAVGEEATGALFAGIRLVRFSAVPSTLELPGGALAYLVDAGGQLLAANAPVIAGGLGAPEVAALLDRPGTPTVLELESDVPRLFVAEGVLGGRLFVVVGLPTPRWSWLQGELLVGIFAPVVMMVLAILAIWVATDWLINRHVRTLATAARAYDRGALDLAPRLVNAPRELRELGEAMSRMARRIQSREVELRTSLDEKDVLLHEIHHRVKNNLQIVTSLLNLRAQSVLSPSARQTMMEAQVRIKALALVHRNLYEQNDVRTIELSTFLRDLCEMLRDILQPETDAEVVLELRAAPTEVATDQAIPIALIVTEAVSNAFRHAFRAGRGGRVVVDLAREADETVLVIADDGIGMAASGERGDGPGTGPAGVGMTLITMLAKQVGARLAIEQQAGTRIILRFAAAGPADPAGA